MAADTDKIGAFAATSSSFSKKSATVSFEGAFAINYYFTPSVEVAGDRTPEAYTNADVLTAENASITTAMTATGDERYWADITGIATKSLSTYCVKNAGEGNAMNALAEATAIYGYHPNQYFTT